MISAAASAVQPMACSGTASITDARTTSEASTAEATTILLSLLVAKSDRHVNPAEVREDARFEKENVEFPQY